MDIFTRLYDELMDPSVYENWLAFFDKEVTSAHRTVLDLGCGSGTLSMAIKEKGYDITGADVSVEMLSEAYNRQVTHNLYFPLIQLDMRDLSDLPKYDVIVSSLDVLCYLADFREVQAVFEQVYSHLNAGGIFLFDVHSLYQMTQVFPGYQYHSDSEDAFFAWSSYYGEEEGSVSHDLTVFERQSGLTYTRNDHTIVERSYPLADYKAGLKSVGFGEINYGSDADLSPVEETTQRLYFSCVKQGG